jgi:CMP-N-acetylneuraminic acid synthetase
MSVNVFLPCRAGSERVPEKNVKPFGRFQNGLIELKLSMLLKCEAIDSIFLSTNDEKIIRLAEELDHEKINIHKRCESLSGNETSTDDLISHAAELIPDGHILWTHVTSPFIDESVYTRAITKYFHCLKNGYDSLMSVNVHKGFYWNEKGPLNYRSSNEKWPRTQTISPLYEVNSGIFLSSRLNYINLSDRIGRKPFLMELNKVEGFDIDWPEDFIIAQSLAEQHLK